MKKYTAWIAFTFALAGCSGMTQMQDTISKYDQGAHTVATGQMAFFRQVQLADCNNQFYSSAYDFSIKKTDKLDLSGTCNPTILDNNQIKIRQALMDSLTLYADKIQTLATSDDNKSLDANSQGVATQLNGLATNHGLSGISLAKDVETAVIEITEMALDKRKFDDIKTAAKTMNPYIRSVVDALKTENSTFAIGMASKMEQIEPQLHMAVLLARNNAVQDCMSKCEQIRKNNPRQNLCIQNIRFFRSPRSAPGQTGKISEALAETLGASGQGLCRIKKSQAENSPLLTLWQQCSFRCCTPDQPHSHL